MSNQARARCAGESRDQTDLSLHSTDGLPRDPDAVGRSKFRHSMMPFELFGGEDEFLVRGCAVGFIRIIIRMDDELTIDRDCLVLLIVKIEPAAETLGRGLPLGIQDVGCPDGNDSARLGCRLCF